MNFSDINLHESLLKHLETVQFTKCTPIQEKVIPLVLEGKSVMAQAQTGTGKTAAFLIPLLHYLIKNKENDSSSSKAQVLVISPTRELSMQIMDDAALLGAQAFNINEALLYGGGSFSVQEKQLQNANIIIATPGRLLDFCNKNRNLLSDIEYFVLDEADRLFDMGFYPDLTKIIRYLPPQEKRKNLLFSATLSEKVRQMAYRDLNRPEEVEIPSETITVDAITQKLFHLQRNEKVPLAIGMLKKLKEGQTAIVFVNTKREVENLAARLTVNGIACDYIMGDLPQSRRLSVIQNIKLGKVPVLIATDVAARGLHVNDLDLVINYDLPEDPQNYIHRIGRTGRAGKTGEAVSFACDQYVFFLESIEQTLGFKIPVVPYSEQQKIAVSDVKKDSSRREVQQRGQAMMNQQRGGKPAPKRQGEHRKKDFKQTHNKQHSYNKDYKKQKHHTATQQNKQQHQNHTKPAIQKKQKRSALLRFFDKIFGRKEKQKKIEQTFTNKKSTQHRKPRHKKPQTQYSHHNKHKRSNNNNRHKQNSHYRSNRERTNTNAKRDA